MAIGIPYVEALNMPLHIAVAFINEERLTTASSKEKFQTKYPNTQQHQQSQRSNTVTKSYISTERKHSKPKIKG